LAQVAPAAAPPLGPLRETKASPHPGRVAPAGGAAMVGASALSSAMDRLYLPVNRQDEEPQNYPTLLNREDNCPMERGDSFLDISSNRSMQLVNDPRFMATNIIDKRLGAFDKMGVISGLLTGTALEACFRLTKYLNFGICVPAEAHTVVESIVQLVSFVIMSSILFMSLYSTLVSVYQAYYTYRLMTAGANGFELARTFYLDPVMVKKRHRAVKLLGWGLLLLMISSGGMLYAKFSKEGDFLDSAADSSGKGPSAGLIDCMKLHWIFQIVNPLGLATFVGFAWGSVFLYYKVVHRHKVLFDRLYAKVYIDDMPQHGHSGHEGSSFWNSRNDWSSHLDRASRTKPIKTGTDSRNSSGRRGQQCSFM